MLIRVSLMSILTDIRMTVLSPGVLLWETSSLNPTQNSWPTAVMSSEDGATWKFNYYFFKISLLLDDYLKRFVVEADNVGSKQMLQIHTSLRRRTRCWWARTPWYGRPSGGTWNTTVLWRNCFFIYRGVWALCSPRRTALRLGTCCRPVKVSAASRAGALVRCEVTVPAQNTSLEPERTSFF